MFEYEIKTITVDDLNKIVDKFRRKLPVGNRKNNNIDVGYLDYYTLFINLETSNIRIGEYYNVNSMKKRAVSVDTALSISITNYYWLFLLCCVNLSTELISINEVPPPTPKLPPT